MSYAAARAAFRAGNPRAQVRTATGTTRRSPRCTRPGGCPGWIPSNRLPTYRSRNPKPLTRSSLICLPRQVTVTDCSDTRNSKKFGSSGSPGPAPMNKWNCEMNSNNRQDHNDQSRTSTQ